MGKEEVKEERKKKRPGRLSWFRDRAAKRAAEKPAGT
jgi:hypothetical protein